MSALRQIIHELKHDRKKLGIVVSLVAVGVLMWGRLLLKQVPKTASAVGDDAMASAQGSGDTRDGRVSPVVTLGPTPSLQRDLFLLDPNRYSRTAPLVEDNFVAKSPNLTSDDAVRMAVVKAAEELKLQSVTLGEVPAAFINGRLIRVGGTIEGFRLVSCDERSAILESRGIKVRLMM